MLARVLRAILFGGAFGALLAYAYGITPGL